MFRSLVIVFVLLLFTVPQFTMAQDLNPDIIRRVNDANMNLDKAEMHIKNGKITYARPRLKAVRRQYDSLVTDFNDQIGQNHPSLLKIKKRLTEIEAQLSSYSMNVDTTDSAPKPKKMALAADALRRIKAADRQLIWVKMKAKNRSKALKHLDAAKREYENIFMFQKGRFNPDHIEIIALKKRIDEAQRTLIIDSSTTQVTVSNSAMTSEREDLKLQMNQDLRTLKLLLSSQENRLKKASDSVPDSSKLKILKTDQRAILDKFNELNNKYKNLINVNNKLYLKLKARIENSDNALSKLETKFK